jgi:hypothetical protein
MKSGQRKRSMRIIDTSHLATIQWQPFGGSGEVASSINFSSELNNFIRTAISLT